jgi:hypothetical protein
MPRRLASVLLGLAFVVANGQAAVGSPPIPPPVSAPPPTLQGESLFAAPIEIQARCNLDGSGTVSFASVGTAHGPYEGTFSEAGVVTFGPPHDLGDFRGFVSLVLDFAATFQISSLTGDVAGTKLFSTRTITPGQPTSYGLCRSENFFVIDIPASYEARITTQDATVYRDDGITNSVITSAMFEAFQSDRLETIALPTPPGSSPLVQPGRGCGDHNHLHIDVGACPTK